VGSSGWRSGFYRRSLDDRLHDSYEFPAAVASAKLKSKVPGADFRRPDHVLRISDGTRVSKPGSKGTDWRVHAVYDLGAVGFSHFEVMDAHRSESLDRGAAIAAEIRLAGRNYSTSSGFPRLVASAGEAASADHTVWLRWSLLRLSAPEGEKFDLVASILDMKAD